MFQTNDRQLLSTLDPRNLELTLMPTEQCNFRCSYCYEDFSIGKMSPRVQAALKRLIVNRIEGLNHLSFQWFGGEPLAAKSLVYELSAFAQKLCMDHGVGFGGALTTNGYLLDMPTIRKLFELGQRAYQISLDGLGEAHDRTRKLASGAGTFERIWANLKMLRNSNLAVSVLLRVHLTPENSQSVIALSGALREEFLHDSRFSVLLKPIENLGGPNSANIASLSKAGRTELLGKINRVLYRGSPPASLTKTAFKEVCYASRPNSFVIRADGRVQKCSVALSDAHNTVGNLADDGSIQLDRSLMGKWMRGYETGEPRDLSCPAQYFPQTDKAEKFIPVVQVL
ncbi:radical SAM protein [Pseudomonas chlororaphis]|uniref:radical SAM protein n=1 Tax=Pseudomonas chlororaphis TaxID=587753 RepID=UPI001CB90D70|nr:radical SAM protein [Pseudomonas chlororaphis]